MSTADAGPIRRFFYAVGARMKIDPRLVIPLVQLQLLPWFMRFTLGRSDRDGSLYYNGVVYVRVMLPFYIGLMVRWRGCTDCKAFLQTHVGWKLNGDFAPTFRIQSDASGAAGYDFPNYGQAKGWEDGPK